MPADHQQDTAILVLKRGDKDAELIISLLDKVGLRVYHSSNANDALDLFSSTGASARLLIVDETASPAAMPGFLECVRSLNPGIRILAITDGNPSEPPAWIRQGNIRAFLTKPFRRAKFLGSVLEIIGEPLVRSA
jgi:DNA-binding NtrC family response regulator